MKRKKEKDTEFSEDRSMLHVSEQRGKIIPKFNKSGNRGINTRHIESIPRRTTY